MFRPLATVDEFVPEPAVQRVSFMLCDERGVLVDASNRTIVARWPTDGAGRVDAAAVRRGEVDVLLWTLPTAALTALRALTQRWPPTDSDFRISGAPNSPLIVPLLTSMRTLSADLGLDLEARVQTTVRALAA